MFELRCALCNLQSSKQNELKTVKQFWLSEEKVTKWSCEIFDYSRETLDALGNLLQS